MPPGSNLHGTGRRGSFPHLLISTSGAPAPGVFLFFLFFIILFCLATRILVVTGGTFDLCCGMKFVLFFLVATLSGSLVVASSLLSFGTHGIWIH